MYSLSWLGRLPLITLGEIEMKDSENGRVRSEMGMLKAIICEVRDRLATKTKILYIFFKSLKNLTIVQHLRIHLDGRIWVRRFGFGWLKSKCLVWIV